MKNLFSVIVMTAILAGCGGSGQSQTEFKTLPSNMSTTGGN